MISILLLVVFLFGSYSLEPSDLVKCKTCKWFVNNKKGLEEEGLCKLFSKIMMNKQKRIVKVYNNATNYCRKRENLCGKKGKLHMDIEEENTKSKENKNTEEITEEINKEITKEIVEKITEQMTNNNNDTIEEILNMSKETYDYYNFLTGKLDEDPTTPE